MAPVLGLVLHDGVRSSQRLLVRPESCEREDSSDADCEASDAEACDLDITKVLLQASYAAAFRRPRLDSKGHKEIQTVVLDLSGVIQEIAVNTDDLPIPDYEDMAVNTSDFPDYEALLESERQLRLSNEEKLRSELSEKEQRSKELSEERDSLVEQLSEQNKLLESERRTLVAQMTKVQSEQEKLQGQLKDDVGVRRSLIKEVSLLLEERDSLLREVRSASSSPRKGKLRPNVQSRNGKHSSSPPKKDGQACDSSVASSGTSTLTTPAASRVPSMQHDVLSKAMAKALDGEPSAKCDAEKEKFQKSTEAPAAAAEDAEAAARGAAQSALASLFVRSVDSVVAMQEEMRRQLSQQLQPKQKEPGQRKEEKRVPKTEMQQSGKQPPEKPQPAPLDKEQLAALGILDDPEQLSLAQQPAQGIAEDPEHQRLVQHELKAVYMRAAESLQQRQQDSAHQHRGLEALRKQHEALQSELKDNLNQGPQHQQELDGGEVRQLVFTLDADEALRLEIVENLQQDLEHQQDMDADDSYNQPPPSSSSSSSQTRREPAARPKKPRPSNGYPVPWRSGKDRWQPQAQEPLLPAELRSRPPAGMTSPPISPRSRQVREDFAYPRWRRDKQHSRSVELPRPAASTAASPAPPPPLTLASLQFQTQPSAPSRRQHDPLAEGFLGQPLRRSVPSQGAADISQTEWIPITENAYLADAAYRKHLQAMVRRMGMS